MTELQKHHNTPTDEIDLLELFAKGVIAIRNNFKFLTIAFITGSLLGLAFYQFSPKVFESSMIIQSDILTESYGARIAKSMGILIKENNWDLLGNMMGLRAESASSLTNFQIESIKQKQANSIEKDNIAFIVTVRTLDKSILPQLQEGLINYLRNNEFVKVRVRQKQEYCKAMVEKIGREINSLDSLKKQLLMGNPIRSTPSETIFLDPANIYSELIKLSKEQFQFKNELEIANSIQLIDGFTVYDRPVFPKLSISLSAGASIGLSFVFALMAIKAIRKVVKLSEEKIGKN